MASKKRTVTSKNRVVPAGAKVVRVLGDEGISGAWNLRHLAWSPDGQWLAGAYQGNVLIWNAHTGKQEAILKANYSSVLGLAFDPVKPELYTATGFALNSWALPASSVAQPIRSIQGDFSAFAISHNGQRIITTNHDTMSIWDSSSFNLVDSIRGAGGNKILLRAVGNDHALVLGLGSYDVDLQLWDFTKGIQTETVQGCNVLEPSVAVSPDGRFIVFGGTGEKSSVKLWDRQVKKVVGEINSWGSFAVFSSDGTTLAVASMPGTTRWVTFYETASLRTLGTVRAEGDLSTGCFSPDGTRFAAGGPETRIYVWDTQTFEEVYTGERHSGAVLGVGFTDEERLAITLDIQGGWRWWDLQNNSCGRIGEYRIWTMAVARTEVAAEGGWFTDKVTGWWDPKTKEIEWRPAANAPWVYAPAVATEGSRATLVGNLGKTEESLRRTWQAKIDTLGPYVEIIGFSNSGSYALIRLQKEIRLIELPSLQTHAILSDIGPMAALDENGNSLLVAGPRWRVRLYSLPSFSLVWESKGPAPGAFSMAVAPDAVRSAVSDRQGRIYVFDGAGVRVATIDPIGGKVHSMSFSQDGSRLLIGTDDGLARVLELSASEING